MQRILKVCSGFTRVCAFPPLLFNLHTHLLQPDPLIPTFHLLYPPRILSPPVLSINSGLPCPENVGSFALLKSVFLNPAWSRHPTGMIPWTPRPSPWANCLAKYVTFDAINLPTFRERGKAYFEILPWLMQVEIRAMILTHRWFTGPTLHHLFILDIAPSTQFWRIAFSLEWILNSSIGSP